MDDLILLIIGFCITLIFVGGAFIHGVTNKADSDSDPSSSKNH